MNLFSGRRMTCKNCGWEFQSLPNVSSQWTTIEMDGRLTDICPFCWHVPLRYIPHVVQEAHAKFLKEKGRSAGSVEGKKNE